MNILYYGHIVNSKLFLEKITIQQIPVLWINNNWTRLIFIWETHSSIVLEMSLTLTSTTRLINQLQSNKTISKKRRYFTVYYSS